jgi:hypothetical protein
VEYKVKEVSQPEQASSILAEQDAATVALVTHRHQTPSSSAFQHGLIPVTLHGVSRPSVLDWDCIVGP